MRNLGVAWRLLINLPRLIIAIPMGLLMLSIAAVDSFVGMFDK